MSELRTTMELPWYGAFNPRFFGRFVVDESGRVVIAALLESLLAGCNLLRPSIQVPVTFGSCSRELLLNVLAEAE
jgi:hypothetical protein